MASKQTQSLPDLIREYLEAQKKAKDSYTLADHLLLKVAKRMKVGEDVRLDENTMARLVNNFRGKTIVWGHGGVRKYAIDLIPTQLAKK